jgi:hypothetical protein
MNKLVDFAPDLAVAIASAGVFGYLIALGLAAFFSARAESLGGRLASWFTKYPAQNLGVPCAAFSAFAIVAIFMKLFPSQASIGEQLELKLFSLEFSGPSGPITLWLMCFLGSVAALKFLRNP